MSNSYFKFKQFTIHQDRCAMKVCTDSCVFGAALPLLLPNGGVIKTALDVGTGTGLLSLMYAQMNANVQIYALELDERAAQQASENIAASIYHQQITVQCMDMVAYNPPHQFDLIFCNPPFYENDLKSPDSKKNIAHHSTEFNIKDLLTKAQLWLDDDGVLALLLPTSNIAKLCNYLSNTPWQVYYTFNIYITIVRKDFRTIIFLSKKNQDVQTAELIIKEQNKYSDAFTELMRPYYLFL